MTSAEVSAAIGFILLLGEAIAIFFLAMDLSKVRDRVGEIARDEEALEADEKHLEDQDAQLRVELDEIHAGLAMLARAERNRDPLTSWDDNRAETREGAAPRPFDPKATQVFSPGAPRLPSFEDRDTDAEQLLDGIWGGRH